jgi:hypothetical protein
MPPILLILLAGAGIAYVATKKPALAPAPAPHPPVPLHPPVPPVPQPPGPVVSHPSLKTNEAYHVTARVTLDASTDLAALLAGHLPSGLVPLTPPVLVPDPPMVASMPGHTVHFDGAWMGQDGALLSSLNNAAITFLGAIDAGAFDPSSLIPPGLDPSQIPPLPPLPPLDPGPTMQTMPFPGSDPGQFGGAPGGIGLPPPGPGLPPPGGAGNWLTPPGGGPPVFYPSPPAPPLPPPGPIVSFGPHGPGLPPPPPPGHYPGSYGPHPVPKPPIQSFGPHATARAQAAQSVQGTLSQYHPHYGSAFRHWPYDVRPVGHLPAIPPGTPGAPVGVAGTLSGYNPHQQDWNRYPLRRAGSGNGHQ